MKKSYINTANVLTFSRILLGFVFLLLFVISKQKNLSYSSIFIIEIISLFVFIIAIITDALDGYFARKENQVTEFGKHFDPLADSIFFIIVFAAFFYLKLMPWFFLILIILREAFMHIYLRPYFKSKGIYLPANIYGKIKTIFQSIFSLAILGFLIFESFLVAFYNLDDSKIAVFNVYLNTVSFIFFGIIAFLSLFSLLIYLLKFKQTFNKK